MYHLGQTLITYGLKGDSHFHSHVGKVIRIEEDPVDGTPIYILKINRGIVNLSAELAFREENLRPVEETNDGMGQRQLSR